MLIESLDELRRELSYLTDDESVYMGDGCAGAVYRITRWSLDTYERPRKRGVWELRDGTHLIVLGCKR